jgi:hypothetical protein
MAWYAIYRIADSELVSVGTVIDPATLPGELTFTPLASRPDPQTQVWDKVTHTFIAKVATKAELEIKLVTPYTVWHMWKDTLAEATARSLPAAAITALTNKTNAAWTDYVNAIEAWRNA